VSNPKNTYALGSNWELKDAGSDTPTIVLWYPRCEDSAKHILVELSDVRAADGIRISYDFGRDGWVIEQAAVFEWAVDDEIGDPEWAEVAFISAWGRKRDGR
jgi:hypothetical protein